MKRGQITIFIILGIVIVALAVLLIAFRKEVLPTPATSENLNRIMKDVKGHITDCIEKVSEEPIDRIALQGGYLEVPAGSYRLWNDTMVSYLCYNIPDDERCMNRLLTRKHMEEELEKAINEGLKKCIDVEGVASGGLIKTFDVIAKQAWKTSVTIAKDNVVIELDFPITLKSKTSENSVSETKFTVKVNKPLGELYDVAQDIIDAETGYGRFDTLTYMLAKMSRYTIYLHKPYPDKIYQIRLREGSYIFQFAVEGEEGF